MDELIGRISEALRRGLGADAQVDLEATPTGRIGGFVVWAGFADRDAMDRQKRIWDVLDQELERSEAVRIVAIVTLTPEEAGVDAA